METPNTVNELLDNQEGVDETTNDEVVNNDDGKYCDEPSNDKEVRKLMKKVLKRNPVVGLEVAAQIMAELEAYHCSVLKDRMDEDDHDGIVIWTKDLSTIRNIQYMMSTITR